MTIMLDMGKHADNANNSNQNQKNHASVPALHIALITETWPPEINGVANSVHQLAKGLVQAGNHITLVRPKPAQFTSTCVQKEVFVTAHAIPMYQNLQFGQPDVLKLVKHFKKHKPDVVHIVTEGPLGMAALLAARVCKLPVSSGYHSQFDDFSTHLGFQKLSKPITAFLNWFHNRCDLTCVPSQKSFHGLHAAGVKNLHIVGRGVDTQSFHPTHRSTALRQSWGADDDTTVVMYVGRVSPEKNIDLTIKSYRALQKAQPHRKLKLVIVGDGPAFESLKASTPEAIFTGAKTGKDLSAHYASGDAFVFASEVETFGNVVTEAMASGLAVVAYHDAAAARFVTTESGWTVPKSDATAFVNTVANLADMHTLKTKGMAAQAQMQHMGWDTAVKQFYQGFAKAISHKKPQKKASFKHVLSENWVQ